MVKKKKITKFRLLFLAKFEQKGLFVSFKLIKKKKPKNSEIKPVQYLKTSRYVIPIPSEDNNEKTNKKSSKIFLLEFPVIKLYKYYDNLFWLNKNSFQFSLNVTYYPDEFSELPWFNTSFKFVIMWALNNIYRLLVENSFLIFWLHPYFTEKKLKYFSNIFFKKMFEKFINPNLPLKRKKGENFISKQQGTALLQIWQLILKQLTFETLKINYQFSDDEIKIFDKALIDPFDFSYYWPTWRLFLLGVSYHDGKISKPNSIFFWSFNQIPISNDIDKKSFFFCKKLILSQFIFWKSAFLELILNNKLIYNPNSINNSSFWCLVLNKFDINNDIYKSNFFLKEFVQNKFSSSKIDVVWVVNIPIPTHYLGTSEFFFKKKFLIQKNFYNQDSDLDLSLLNETNLDEFLKKFLFFPINNKKFNLNIFEQLIIKNKFINLNYEELSKNSSNFNFFKNFTPKTFIDFMRSNSNNFSKINKNKTFIDFTNTEYFLKNNVESENIIPIPEFLQRFFFMLCQYEISLTDLDQICIQPFIHHLSLFNYYKNLANSKFEEFIAPINVFKEYLNLRDHYDIPSATIAYKALKELLKNLPNKDIALRWAEPFGLNPFFELNNTLTSSDVEFPKLVNYYNYYNYLKKKLITFPDFLPLDLYKLNLEISFFFKNLNLFVIKIFQTKLISVSLLFTNYFFKNLFFKLKSKFFIFNNLNLKFRKRVALFININFKGYLLNLKKNKKKFYSLIWEFHDSFDEFDENYDWDFLSKTRSNFSSSNEIILKNKIFLKKKFITDINSRQKFFFITKLSFKNLKYLTFIQYFFNLKIINIFLNYRTSNDFSSFFDSFWKLSTKVLINGIYNFSSFDYLKLNYILKYFKLIINWKIIFKLKK